MKAKTGLNEQILTAIVVGLLLLGCFVVLRPFLSALLWAIILSFATWPVFRRLQTLLGQRRNLAAAIMTLSIAVVFLAPFLIIAISLADDVAVLATRIRQAFDAGPPTPPDWLERVPLVGTKARLYWLSLAGDSSELMTQLKRFIEPAAAWLLFFGGQLARGLFELAISILLSFFLYRDGPAAAHRLTLAVER